jgi:hypothetical protein
MPSNTTFRPVHENEFTANGLNLNCLGVDGYPSSNASTNLDIELLDDNLLTGCEIVCENPQKGDYWKLQVVHPSYGVVNQFGDKWFTGSISYRSKIIVPYSAKLSTGLIIRAVYVSVNSTAPEYCAVNYFFHKVLV